MKLLWHGSWLDTPGYHVPDVAVLIDVIATIPVMRLAHASGRVTRQPYRKVATFLWTDGPRSTLRKVRSKREEAVFTGDFRTTVILGRAFPSKKQVVALGCRLPAAAQQVPIHRGLVREVADAFSVDDLLYVSSFIEDERELLAHASRQNFLYSAIPPSVEIENLLDRALDSHRRTRSMPSKDSAALIKVPDGLGEAADTLLQVHVPRRSAGPPVALLGAGDYARTEVIPALHAAGLALHVVANREPQIATMVAKEHHFALATTDAEQAIAELPQPGLVVVATAHDSHAQLANVAVQAGHRVFVEKPPVVTPEDVTVLAQAMMTRPGAIEIGFNRRYHPLLLRARKQLQCDQGPTSITCVIKEIPLEPDHWYFWPNQGTRITGNLCHWIDLAVFLLEGTPLPVSLTLSPAVEGPALTIDEERVLTVTFADGSLLTILATSRGDDVRGVQEQIEIRRGLTTVMIDDLWKMRVRRNGIDRFTRTLFRNKAHGRMYRAALRRFLHDEPAIYPAADMVVVSAIQIAASEMARNGQRQAEIPGWMRPRLQELVDHQAFAASQAVS